MFSEPFVGLHFQTWFPSVIGSIAELFRNAFSFLERKLCWHLCSACQWRVLWQGFGINFLLMGKNMCKLAPSYPEHFEDKNTTGGNSGTIFLLAFYIWVQNIFLLQCFVMWSFIQLYLWLVCSGSIFFLLIMLGLLEACGGFSLIRPHRAVQDFFL